MRLTDVQGGLVWSEQCRAGGGACRPGGQPAALPGAVL
ncbi:hypothetical protein MXL77_00920 [Serratia rhizosphaerae]|nr:hypothetical protein [Serratia rhizosphaerae]MEB6334253.1 hypothetical protein [Serratia rhizosphaerae]